jgi:Txe/YoeB family toxin of Txe-Axe toxin-antitoxin module
VPSVSFLDELPTKVAAEIQAVLEAVATAPPPAFSGGGKWEAMHGDMHGIYG